MGACASASALVGMPQAVAPHTQEALAIEASKQIDKANLEDHKMELKKVKLLLLGAGESGKSTIFKQMKLIHGQGFSNEMKLQFRRHIWDNIIEAMVALCQAARKFNLDNDIEGEGKEAWEKVLALSEPDNKEAVELGPELGICLKMLWDNPVIQMVWARRSEFQIIDTTYKFLDRISDIADPNYLPSTEDILFSRVRTSGIIEEKFIINNATFVFFDVGGQRNERRKWIACFSEVTAVIFVAALSEYDQRMFEDEDTNRMVEALHLFEEMCNGRWFVSTPMILFLNKSDLYEQKIKLVPIHTIPEFFDYSGTPNSYEEGIEYFVGKFVSLNKSPSREVYYHVTNATNTENINVVFQACQEIILRTNMEDVGI